MEIGFFYPEMF